MELYHSLPFFFYLLSTCIPKPGQKAVHGLFSLFKIGLTVILTFLLIWFPFVSDFETALTVVHRLFPFDRGIFEDKVANFWCVLNVFYKLRYCNHSQLMKLCLFTTLSAVFPSGIDLFSRPNSRKFILALLNNSLAFFLFSYQVHEKSILIVALPVLLYLPENPFVCFWFLFISVFSMVPLFVKDDLLMATISLVLFYTVTFFVCMQFMYNATKNTKDQCPKLRLLGNIFDQKVNKKNKSSGVFKKIEELKNDSSCWGSVIFLLGMFVSLLGCLIIFILYFVIQPPKRYPDLFPLLISSYSCVHFVGFFLYFNWKQLQIPQDFGDIGNVKVKEN